MWHHGNKIALLGVILSLLFAATGCRPRVPLPPRPYVVVPSQSRYAPPQAKARHHYRYFPDYEVYFDTTRNLYFYLNDNIWLSAPALPGHIRIDLNNFVTTELDDPKPFKHHRDMVKRHPPGIHKEKVRERDEDRRKEPAENRPEARKKGKGNRPESSDRKKDKKRKGQDEDDNNEEEEGRRKGNRR